MSIMKEAEYPLVIVAMEEIIEIRPRDSLPDKPAKSYKSNRPDKTKGEKASKNRGGRENIVSNSPYQLLVL